MDSFNETLSGSDVAVIPSARSGLPVWADVVVFVGAVALVGVVALVSTAAVVVPKMQEQEARSVCMGRLSRLAHLFVSARPAKGTAAQRHGGAALWLSYRRSYVRSGDEKAFVCPGDPLAIVPHKPEQSAVYERIDMAHVPRALCSYAGRDFALFPIEQNSGRREVIAACIHHKGGANVAFEGGDAMFMSLAELGVSADDEKTVGPDSKSPILRVVRYGDGSVR